VPAAPRKLSRSPVLAKKRGAVASEALGPASISYAVASIGSDDLLAGTRYGQAFLALRAVIRGRGSALVANSRIRQS